jgi:outer membrane protein
MYSRFFLPAFLLIFSFSGLNAQQYDTIMTLSLQEVVSLAQGEAPSSQIAETRLGNNFWRYQSFLADYRPRFDLSADLGGLNRSLEGVTQPDGTVLFIERALMSNFMGISLRQEIAATGGTIFANTNLNRLDIFGTDNFDASTSYLFSPINIRFVQPILAFNNLKWRKRVEPLRFKESQREYSEELEQIALQGAQLFFDVYIAQLNVGAAQKEKSNADTLFNVSKGRFEVGRIAETELLQIELSAMRADANLAQATLDLQTANEALRSFLGVTKRVQFFLEEPVDIPSFPIDAGRALAFARENRSQSIEFQRRAIEADREVARSRREIGPSFNLVGEFGLQQRVENTSEFFQGLLDQERLSLGVQVPIADWGKAKAALQIAVSQRDLELMNIEQERVRFEQEILLKVQQFDLIRNQVALAQRTYEVSQKRNTITRQRYLIGKIGITDLNIAISEEDSARRSYMSALRSFWVAYYELRQLTLYDFENDRSLIRAIPEF